MDLKVFGFKKLKIERGVPALVAPEFIQIPSPLPVWV